MEIAAFSSETFMAILPEVLLLALAALVLLFDMVSGRSQRGWFGGISTVGLLAILVVAILYSRPGAEDALILGGMLRHDWPAFSFKVVLLFAAAIATLLSSGLDTLSKRGEYFALLIVASLDSGRFGWSNVPLSVHIAGWAGLAVAFLFASWAMLSNTYASRTVRIQSDRGHQVVTTGPYRYVRHPMYVGTIFFGVCTPLFLGSWWALVPGGLLAGLFVVRTALEDRTLREELPGYAEYAERVRYRLLPGVW